MGHMGANGLSLDQVGQRNMSPICLRFIFTPHAATINQSQKTHTRTNKQHMQKTTNMSPVLNLGGPKPGPGLQDHRIQNNPKSKSINFEIRSEFCNMSQRSEFTWEAPPELFAHHFTHFPMDHKMKTYVRVCHLACWPNGCYSPGLKQLASSVANAACRL